MITAVLWLVTVSCGAASHEQTRIVHIHLVDPQQRPVVHRGLRLEGLERWCLQQGPVDETDKFWTFSTDANGNATVRIGAQRGDDDEQRPGWGAYQVIAEAGPDDAGGRSEPFWFENTDLEGHRNDPGRAVPPEGLNLTISTVNGFTIEGKVVDDQNTSKPLIHEEVDANGRLPVDSYTGHAGEIEFRKTWTDKKGNFSFRELYPDTVQLQLSPLSAHVWIKTFRNGAWEAGPLDSVNPDPQNNAVRLVIEGSTTPHFRYFGHVLDAAGKPVAGVHLDLSPSLHIYPSWDDEHGENGLDHPQAVSDANGAYDLKSPTPWALSLNAYAGYLGKGEGKASCMGLVGAAMPPGRYDITLKQ